MNNTVAAVEVVVDRHQLISKISFSYRLIVDKRVKDSYRLKN